MAYCPLLLKAVKDQGGLLGESGREAAECLKGECAWYVVHPLPPSEGCALLSIAESLKALSLD
jgi:hypothetical protein